MRRIATSNSYLPNLFPTQEKPCAYCILRKSYLCNRCTNSHQLKSNWSICVRVHCYIHTCVNQVIGCPWEPKEAVWVGALSVLIVARRGTMQYCMLVVHAAVAKVFKPPQPIVHGPPILGRCFMGMQFWSCDYWPCRYDLAWKESSKLVIILRIVHISD